MRFNIGDKVRTSNGTVGTIRDKLFSNSYKAYVYLVSTEDNCDVYPADELQHCPVECIDGLYYTIELADNVVVACLFDKGGNEIARGHGHVIHDGIKGFTQAASYALKRIFDQFAYEQ